MTNSAAKYQITVNSSQFPQGESIPSIFSPVGHQLEAASKNSVVDRFFRN
ncbi:MAG: hypothetical protein ACI9LY_004003, partial [Arenicella sp.]